MESAAAASSRREWATGWTAVLVGLSGMMLSSISTYTAGFFMEPLKAEFGWTRAEVSSGLLVFSFISPFVFPLAGKLVDRFGVRAVTLPGCIAAGASFAALGLSNGSLFLWWASWAIFTVLFAAVSPTVFIAAVSRAFVAGRGFAIGVTLCGTFFASIYVPQLTRWSIEAFGWRWAYGIIAASLALIPFFLVLFVLRDGGKNDATPAQHAHIAAEESEASGLSFREALRSPAVLKILAATVISMVLVVGGLVHSVPIMREQGLSLVTATALMGGYGLGTVVGKIGTGWAMDRGANRIVPMLSYASPALTALLLLSVHGRPAIAGAALFIQGFAGGAIMSLAAYLLVRYAGTRSFGQLFGLASGLMGLGSGIGPFVAGLVFDAAGTYTPLLIGFIPAALVAGALIGALGRRPELTGAQRDEVPAARPGLSNA
jgi:MFS family permease